MTLCMSALCLLPLLVSLVSPLRGPSVARERTAALFPAEIPDAACAERLDTALLMGTEDGVSYDDESGRWSFAGIVDGTAQDRWGGTTVDLVRVRFEYSGTIYLAWVTAGVTRWDGTYLPSGDWRNRDEMQAVLRPAATYVRVYAGGPDEPVASPEGVDWSACDTAWCAFAQETENLWTLDEGLSTMFTQSGMGASWWPWGYLPWHIEVGRTNAGWCWR